MSSLDPINDELIPWNSLRGTALEELLYGLLDEMGAKELTWRTGGTGGGAADGGRDIEATFFQATPDGEVDSQKWWIEAKGRSGTVEPDAVKSAVINACDNISLDLIVVATNSQFSNPTRDWVQDWIAGHPRPKVRLWDRRDLLRLIRKHPVVAARVIPQVLSSEERLRMLREQLYRFGKPPSHKDLDYYWERRELIVEPGHLATLVYGELLYGDLAVHPWGAAVSESNCLSVLIEATACLPFAIIRSQAVSNEKLNAASAYLIECALQWADPAYASAVMGNPLMFTELPDSMKNDARPYIDAVVRPIWNRCKLELLDACSQDCARVSSTSNDPMILRPSEAGERFWRRFDANNQQRAAELAFRIFNVNMPCSVGLQLGERLCPLEEDPEFTLEEISEIGEIIRYRKAHPSGRYLEILKEDPALYESIAQQGIEMLRDMTKLSDRSEIPEDDIES